MKKIICRTILSNSLQIFRHFTTFFVIESWIDTVNFCNQIYRYQSLHFSVKSKCNEIPGTSIIPFCKEHTHQGESKIVNSWLTEICLNVWIEFNLSILFRMRCIFEIDSWHLQNILEVTTQHCVKFLIWNQFWRKKREG